SQPAAVNADDMSAAPHVPSRAMPMAIGAGGLLLLAGGLGFELWAESRYAGAKSEVTTQARRDSLYRSAVTIRTGGEVLAVTGLAAGGVAVWLYLRGRHRERGAASEVSLHVVPMTKGLVLSGSF